MAATHEPHGHDHATGARDAAPAHDKAAPHSHDDGQGLDDHGHEHEGGGPLGWLNKLGLLHSHKHGALAPDLALEGSAQGIRAVQISLVVLAMTAALQVAVSLSSGSVALLADTIHNFPDAMTASPLWLAFVLGRKPSSRRYTYGRGR